MDFFITLIGHTLTIHLPQTITGWGIIGFYLVILYWRLRHWQDKPASQDRSNQILLALLIILVPFTSLFVGISLNLIKSVQDNLYSGAANLILIPVLAAIPWVLAGGLMKPLYAIISAGVSGLMISAFTQHSLIMPFEYGVIALLYCELLRLRYRGWIYRLIRNPLVAILLSSGLLAVFSIINYSIGEPAWIAGLTGSSFLTLVGIYLLMILPFIIAGITASFISNIYQVSWVKPGPLFQAGNDNALSRRFFTGIGPFVVFLFFALLVGAWLISGSAARKQVQARMAGTASVAADGIPFFINTGTDLLTQYARVFPVDAKSAKDLQVTLAQNIRSVQFFKQMAYVDVAGKVIASYPEGSISTLTQAELGIVQQTVEGGVLNAYTSLSQPGSNQISVAFAVPVKDNLGRLKGVLTGRTDLETNPYTQSIIYLLKSMTDEGGEGYIIDGQGKVIFHPDVKYLNSTYPGELTHEERFYTLTTGNNVQLFIYYRPSKTYNWSVVLAVPSNAVQKATWEVALPLFGLLALAALFIYFILKNGMSSITRSIKLLTSEADRISKGSMDHTQYIRGEDEIGQLGSTFEQMRLNLKDRLEELNLLLSVSQGIATSLNLESALEPILQAALSNGGSMARIVLIPELETDPYTNTPSSFASGEMVKYYGYLDEQVMAITRSRDVVTLNNLIRGRVLKLDPESLNPSAIISVSIRHNNHLLGILWVAYDQPRTIPDSEVRFLSTLASDVALAVSNIRLYKSAELGKKRLIAILESTPDPIFVIDQNETILLANNPAREIFKGNELFIEGKKIREVIKNQELIKLLRSEGETREIHLNKQRVFYTTVSDMTSEHGSLGKVCLLRDISHFKEADTLKSEFVATVSHDLRAPLTLMRGNATMIQMAGDINEQQKNYVAKILAGIESMTRMVNNLLDLDRIEAISGLQLEAVQVQGLINKVLGDLHLQAIHKNIDVKNELPEESEIYIQADAALFQQALYNLVDNAIKYSPVGGTVTVACKEKAGTVVIEVTDEGKGIAPLDIPQLFEKFYRSSQREGYAQKPSTMGLAIVKSVAERHGGKVSVISQLGKGSTFYLQVPSSVRSGEKLEDTDIIGE
ncbi:MAG: hypothetical protein C0391_06455 [Anaerolinea sp.]|nr:hypothetical protein [Anaerolinea sp.]